ncbi:MAG: 23S rRNA (guanosine(2251)-2'-O)-methyltransferase RlmB [Synergistaceae bacterium]|jgi:23S rRNA (guanosine2251-2'-O)-methyltransferase|nr:23S rRNA (guanosine(2251)-2'-O)-methyltransferase RlmB [Synergistaceae bacterium]
MKRHLKERHGKSPENYCWGRNPVLFLLSKNPSRCLKVFISKTTRGFWVGKITKLCSDAGIPFTFVGLEAMSAVTGGENHQGVAAAVSPVDVTDFGEALEIVPRPPEPAMAVIMDHIEDPRNMGAIIRSAEAAGALFAAFPSRRGALPTGTVAKTSAGASLRFPLASLGNVANAINEAQKAGFWTIGLDEEAPGTIYDSPLPARCVFVVGGEGSGMSRAAGASCDESLRVPMKGEGGSLNASVAASVCMFEWARANGNFKSTERKKR